MASRCCERSRVPVIRRNFNGGTMAFFHSRTKLFHRVGRRRFGRQLTVEPLESRCLLSYTITDLGAFPVTGDSVAHGISDDGQIVGRATTSAGYYHAFLLESGAITDLGTLEGENSSTVGVNDAGQVVGNSDVEARDTHAFLWQNGVMTDLGTL